MGVMPWRRNELKPAPEPMPSDLHPVRRLSQLPAPPEGKSGWPWTEESAVLPETMPDGGEWPAISIAIPSYNQGGYLEETIRSVLLQGYPNLEVVVIDGGSSDGSAGIIRKYDAWLDYWVSEQDDGQCDAINRGFAKTGGEIFNWLCSDDFLTRNALEAVALAFREGGGCDVVAGACYCQYDDEPARSESRPPRSGEWEKVPYMAGIWQPSCFYRRALIGRDGLVRMDLNFCMDRELWCYLFKQGGRWRWIEQVLSHYRFTGENKSVVGGQKIIDEIGRIYRGHVKEVVSLPWVLRRVWLPLVLASKQDGAGGVGKGQRWLSQAVAAVLLAVYPRHHVRALQKEFYEYSVW